MSQHINYLTYKNGQLQTIGCMNCGEIIAKREYKKNAGKEIIKPFSNLVKLKFNLVDGSYMTPMFCFECSKKSISLKQLERTLHNGFIQEETNKYNSNKLHKKLKKQRFNKEENDPLPLSYFTHICKSKRISK